MNVLQEQELFELEQNGEESRVYVITDLNGLNWAFRKMSAIHAKVNDVKALAQAERERIDKYELSELAKYENDLAYFTQKITEYHATVLADDPKAKSIKTPYGVAKSTSSKAAPEKADEQALIQYAKSNEIDVVEVKTTESLKWAELKKTLSVVESDGELVVVDSDGQRVPGVTVKPPSVSFKVEVSD
ncbi:host-nuclease inhibitor Gam family protein [Solibacillus sp. MA9]|uniref:Host-nuclease inhibitor Gam family protein n=1 Tax=Solibacillus palustris TaxID=2908203 RepID=A0ABS9UBM5_9BACL|nr:host-nuclease inhibitor Gam family protein [Solibacillus sp. MA9]MCH7321752.1 host-nuclease inhibitor Gam family protein [Solibacillus sp. MA9]